VALIIATGSNLGNSIANLSLAKSILSEHFKLNAESRIYHSKAVDYEAQPDFFNQVLEFDLPVGSPSLFMKKILEIEINLGRVRDVSRGPRTIDIDILFWGLERVDTDLLTVPHPRWQDRSFVVLPLKELPYFQTLKKYFIIPESFTNEAKAL
jgi:2-amino-4-hydroxy-6-hydroxymethyldihydropteridine diphosphokinase